MSKITVPDSHLVQDNQGDWHRRPGRLKISLHTLSESSSDRLARDIVQNPNLSTKEKNKVIALLSQFIHAYEELNHQIHIPLGNVPVSQESTRLRNLWHLYLLRGRELLDGVGYRANKCLFLKQKVTGLNTKKFESLCRILEGEIVNHQRRELEEILSAMRRYKQDILEFIGLRDRDKTCNDTLERPPCISPEGVPHGGLIVNWDTQKNYNFSDYVERSFRIIIEFTKVFFSTRK